MKRIVVLISGNGSNLQAIIDVFHQSKDIEISHVFSNRKAAFGIQRAEKAGIKTTVTVNLSL